ncbi:hypothetical protein B296_00051574, partial [Ensete ventricosum]
EAQAYAEENGLFFMETSAKAAINVNDIFYEIGMMFVIGRFALKFFVNLSTLKLILCNDTYLFFNVKYKILVFFMKQQKDYLMLNQFSSQQEWFLRIDLLKDHKLQHAVLR